MNRVEGRSFAPRGNRGVGTLAVDPRTLLGLLVGACVLAVPLVPALPAQEVVVDAVQCETCRVTQRVEVSLGEIDGPGSLSGMPADVTLDAQGRFWVLFGLEPPVVFEGRGEAIGSVGRMGSGPREFRQPRGVTAWRDSIVVIDRPGRAVVVGPDLSPERSVRMPGLDVYTLLPLPRSRRWVVNATGQSPEFAGWPLHLLDLSGRDATVERSFGSEGGPLLPNRPPRGDVRSLALSAGGGVWTLPRIEEYRIEYWTGEGELGRTLVREGELFSRGFHGRNGGPDIPPSPRLLAIHEDPEGLLWVLGGVPRPDWRRAWEEAGIDELPDSPTDMPVSMFPSPSGLIRSVVEVLDPGAGEVLWRGTLDVFPITILRDGRIIGYREDSRGVPIVDVIRLTLARPRGL